MGVHVCTGDCTLEKPTDILDICGIDLSNQMLSGCLRSTMMSAGFHSMAGIGKAVIRAVIEEANEKGESITAVILYWACAKPELDLPFNGERHRGWNQGVGTGAPRPGGQYQGAGRETLSSCVNQDSRCVSLNSFNGSLEEKFCTGVFTRPLKGSDGFFWIENPSISLVDADLVGFEA
jgi:hypothetical protein